MDERRPRGGESRKAFLPFGDSGYFSAIPSTSRPQFSSSLQNTRSMSLLTVVCLLAFCGLTQAFVYENEGGKTYRDEVPDEMTITIKSPDLRVAQKDILICTSADVPVDSGFMVKIVPQPLTGVRHHISLNLCDGPGHESTGGQNAWECGSQGFGERSSLLPNAEPCAQDTSLFSEFQYQSGSADEASFRLPDGTGVPVGSATPARTIVAIFHFFHTEDLVNGSTAGAAMRVSFKRTPLSPLTPVMGLMVSSHGFLGAKTVSSVSGSWTLDREEMVMRLILLYVHWHENAVDVRVWVVRPSGEIDVMLRQDPHLFAGLTDVSNSSLAVLRPGDRLAFECVFNNTKDEVIRVQTREMCSLTAYFTTGGETPLANNAIVSVDPFYKECLSGLLSSSDAVNYEGVNSFHGASGSDCDSQSAFTCGRAV